MRQYISKETSGRGSKIRVSGVKKIRETGENQSDGVSPEICFADFLYTQYADFLLPRPHVSLEIYWRILIVTGDIL
jgi:hypothetical protein